MNWRLSTSIGLCILSFCLVSDSFGMDKALWGRNPFLTREEIASLRKKKAPPPSHVSTKAPVPQWEVKSIMISGSNKVAIINDHIVAVGDFLGGEKVLAINRDSVVLGGKRGKTVIKLKQPSVSIRTVEKIR